MTTPARGALAGVRVIDMSHQAAGPWCTTLLGDMGADVIKVEKAGRGDSIRHADRSGRLPPNIGGPNFHPGVMHRQQLGYEDLRDINPRLVYCSITAFGQSGPLAQKPGMDLILQ